MSDIYEDYVNNSIAALNAINNKSDGDKTDKRVFHINVGKMTTEEAASKLKETRRNLTKAILAEPTTPSSAYSEVDVGLSMPYMMSTACSGYSTIANEHSYKNRAELLESSMSLRMPYSEYLKNRHLRR